MLDRPAQHRTEIRDAIAAPLLMLPGTLCDARLFLPVLDRLGCAATVPALEGAMTASTMAERILRSAPPRFSLCGFSLGAIVALAIVAEAPERVERLALIGCNPGALDGAARSSCAALGRADFVAASAPPADPRLRRIVDAMANAAPQATYEAQTAVTLTRPDRRAQLNKIGVPTLVLCGEDDPICPPALSIEIARSVPGARLVLVPDAGHYVTLEQPGRVAGELAAWLATPSHHQIEGADHG